MKNFITLTMICSAFLMQNINTAEARPVSYPGGFSVMTMNDGERNTLNLDYSPTSTYAIGYGFEYWREDEFQLHSLNLNNLLKRWNNRDSQGNLYLQSGIGMTVTDDGDNHAAGFTGLTADWENRRLLFAYENRYMAADNDLGQSMFMQSARAGVAPYIGEYGDVHTWLMLEAHHMPEADEPFTVTPLIRLFKGTNLVEAGYSSDGKIMFNFTKVF